MKPLVKACIGTGLLVLACGVMCILMETVFKSSGPPGEFNPLGPLFLIFGLVAWLGTPFCAAIGLALSLVAMFREPHKWVSVFGISACVIGVALWMTAKRIERKSRGDQGVPTTTSTIFVNPRDARLAKMVT